MRTSTRVNEGLGGRFYLIVGISATQANRIPMPLPILEAKTVILSEFLPFYCQKIKRLIKDRIVIGTKILIMSITGYLKRGISMCTNYHFYISRLLYSFLPSFKHLQYPSFTVMTSGHLIRDDLLAVPNIQERLLARVFLFTKTLL